MAQSANPRNGSTTTSGRCAFHIAHCYRIDTLYGDSFFLTNHDRPVDFRGRRYVPGPGVSSFPINSKVGLADKTSKIAMNYGDGVVAPSFEQVDSGRMDRAQISDTQVDWRFPMGGARAFHVFFVTSPNYDELSWSSDLVGYTDLLSRKIGTLQTRDCGNELGENNGVTSFCGVDIDVAPFKLSGVVLNATNRRVFQVATGNPLHVDGWFSGGRVTWNSGLNSGFQQRINAQVSAGGVMTITLGIPMENSIAAGDTVDLFAGCDHTPETCANKFSAYQLYFRGWPNIPGNRSLISPVTS